MPFVEPRRQRVSGSSPSTPMASGPAVIAIAGSSPPPDSPAPYRGSSRTGPWCSSISGSR